MTDEELETWIIEEWLPQMRAIGAHFGNEDDAVNNDAVRESLELSLTIATTMLHQMMPET